MLIRGIVGARRSTACQRTASCNWEARPAGRWLETQGIRWRFRSLTDAPTGELGIPPRLTASAEWCVPPCETKGEKMGGGEKLPLPEKLSKEIAKLEKLKTKIAQEEADIIVLEGERDRAYAYEHPFYDAEINSRNIFIDKLKERFEALKNKIAEIKELIAD